MIRGLVAPRIKRVTFVGGHLRDSGQQHGYKDHTIKNGTGDLELSQTTITTSQSKVSENVPSRSHILHEKMLIVYSLYVTDLPDKLRKDDLRLSLYTLFSTYGPVLDVVALKTIKMRGQAFIVYRDIQASTQAMRALQGFEFFGREMVRVPWGGEGLCSSKEAYAELRVED